MIKPAEPFASMRPHRQERYIKAKNLWEITVTPPRALSFKPSVVLLTQDQYERYTEWRLGKALIQDVLSELSADVREQLMSGIGPEDFAKL